MCESFHIQCQCGKKSAEIFFGKMLLDQSSVTTLYCPDCSKGYEINQPERVWDNGWILELDMDVIRNHASTFGMDACELTASWVFDRGYVTWAGITPDDTITRNREREEFQELAKNDVLAYIKAGGWRKMQ